MYDLAEFDANALFDVLSEDKKQRACKTLYDLRYGRDYEPKWYVFEANWGDYTGPHDDSEKGIASTVIVEAYNAQDANERALKIGLYFDGAEAGEDNPECGDRWYRVEEADALDKPQLSLSDWTARRSAHKGEEEVTYLHPLEGTVIRCQTRFTLLGEHPTPQRTTAEAHPPSPAS